MKRSTIATLATVAGVALLGGGAYAVTQLPGDEPTATATTEPGVIDTATPEPTESEPDQVETPAPVDSETPAPADVEYTDAELRFLADFHRIPESDRGGITDAMIIAAAHEACDQIASGVAPSAVSVDLGTDGQAPQIAEGMGVGVNAWFCAETS